MEDKSTTVPTVATTDDNPNQNVGTKKKKGFSLYRAAMGMLQNRPNEKQKSPKIKKVSKNNSDEKWKKIVGSMRPLHLQDNLSPKPQRPSVTIPAVEGLEDDCFTASPASSIASPAYTMSQYASANNLQELGGVGTMRQSASVGNLQELAGVGGTIKYSMRQSASVGNLQELYGKASGSASTSHLRRLSGTMSAYASALNLHDLDEDEESNEEQVDEDNDKVFDNYDSDVMIDTKADEFIAQFYQQMKSQEKGKRPNFG